MIDSRCVYDDFVVSGLREALIFGVGACGLKTSEHLSRYGINVRAFIDNDPHKVGERINAYSAKIGR